MANTFAPYGFTPIRRVDGASWTGNQSVRKIKASNTNYFFKGDPVVSLSTGYINVVTPAVLTTVGNGQIAGIFVGCEYLSVAKGYVTWSPMFPGGDTTTDVIAYIIDDPNVLFLVQTSNTGGNAMGISYLSATANFGNANTMGTSAAGNTYNGLSGCYLDGNAGTPQTTTNLPFRVYDIPNVQTSGGAPGTAGGAVGNGYDPTTQYNYAIVSINSSDLRAPQAGI